MIWLVSALIIGISLGIIVWVIVYKIRRMVSSDYSLDQPKRKQPPR